LASQFDYFDIPPEKLKDHIRKTRHLSGIVFALIPILIDVNSSQKLRGWPLALSGLFL
jgi:hypothetical protein